MDFMSFLILIQIFFLFSFHYFFLSQKPIRRREQKNSYFYQFKQCSRVGLPC